MAAKIQIRRDTAANWTTNNPTLSSGEMGYETDTNKLKFGNGTDTWTALSYFSPEQDLSAYATESDTQLWVNSQGYLTAHQDISGKADTTYVDTQLGLKADATDNATQTWVSSQGYLTTQYADADVDTHLNTGTATTGQILSYTGTDYDWIDAPTGGGTPAGYNNTDWDTAYGWGDHSTEGYLTAHQDISGKADVSHSHQTFEIQGLNSALSSKAEASNVYSKTESDALYATTAYVDGQVFSGMMKDVGDNITDLGNASGVLSLDYNSGTQFEVVANGDLTFSGVSNMSSGDSIVLDITQDATGGRTWTDTVSAKYAGGENTLSTGANELDTVVIRLVGTEYRISIGKGWA